MSLPDQKASVDALIHQDLSLDDQIRHIMNLSVGALSVDTITYAVQAFRAHMLPVSINAQNAVDLCGTGGDKSGTFNVSTTAAFVVAGAGVPVAKHGNVSITSKSGSIDVLRALGVYIPQRPDEAAAQFARNGMCFLFAPYFHPVFLRFAVARRELALQGERTIFNLLGPLLNPARVTRSVMGVFMPDFVAPLARVLHATGTEKGMVFSGTGLDELSLCATNTIADVAADAQVYTKTAADFGFAPCTLDDLRGGDAQENADITRAILSGTERGAKRDITILNAAAAIYAGSDGATFAQAIDRARNSIDSGTANQKLQECIA